MNNEKTRPLRIVVADFHQETNSFNPKIWSFADFRQDTFIEGNAILDYYGDASGKVLSGILHVARSMNADIIPACAMRATSGGRVDHAVIEYFINSLLKCCGNSAAVDGFIIGVHGATQSTLMDDVCGHILDRLRSAVGPDRVISVGCDMHANITEKCVVNADYICGFQTYPHVDQYDTGVRAAKLAFRKMLDNTKDYLARVSLPMVVPASGYSTGTSPFKEIIDYAYYLVNLGEIDDFTVFQMQPWLDVYPAGSSILTIGKDSRKVRRYASALAERVYRSRERFWPKLYTADEVIDIARSAPAGRPVILVDFADSLGAGALGDSVSVVLKLMERGYPVRTATVVNDKDAVILAEKVGIGHEAQFSLGAGLTPNMPGPARVNARVVSLHDGVFYQEGPVGTGQRRDLGRTAVLSTMNIDIIVCAHPCGTGDIQVYRHFGVEPTDYQLLVVKANTSFRAAYESIAYQICMADTPGIGTANIRALNYKRLPKDFYPFSPLEGYRIESPKLY